MQWMRAVKSKPQTTPPVISSELVQYSRLAGLIQVCRPHWSARIACRSAKRLVDEGVTEFREVGMLSDYMVYLDTQLARHVKAPLLESEAEPGQEAACSLEVRGWAEYWQRFWDRA